MQYYNQQPSTLSTVGTGVVVLPSTTNTPVIFHQSATAPSGGGLGSLYIWYDAIQMNQLYYDGQEVPTIYDYSGNGRNATGTGAKYRSSGSNGIPTLVFSASAYYEANASWGASGITRYYVINGANYPSAIDSSDASTSWFGIGTPGDIMVWNGIGTIPGQLAPTPTGSWMIVARTSFTNGSPVPPFESETLWTNRQTGSIGSVADLGLVFTCPSKYRVGGSTESSEFSGSIAEILIYSATHTSASIAQVFNYLREKYNL